MHRSEFIKANPLLYVCPLHNLYPSLVVNDPVSGDDVRLPQSHCISTAYHQVTSLRLNFLIYKWGNNNIHLIELLQELNEKEINVMCL